MLHVCLDVFVLVILTVRSRMSAICLDKTCTVVALTVYSDMCCATGIVVA